MPAEHPRQLVVVANRLPVRRTADNRWQRSPGGLVSALEPVVRTTERATWVGWTGVADADEEPFTHEGMELVPVPVGEDEKRDFYNGFSNGSLWPLYHDAVFVPQFHDHWWEAYRTVNERFAEYTAAIAEPGATVWVHDYQLQLVPRLLRRRRPDIRIGYFLHIPFPSQELFLRLPWRTELTEGILGADVAGFQTVVGAENFRQVTRRLLGARTHAGAVHHRDGVTRVGTLPVGIDAAEIRRIAEDPATRRRAAEIRSELGSPRTLLLGVDRLDYTKGIEVRLRAYRELLDEGRIDPEDTVLVQIAQPSRDEVPGYAETRELVERIAGSINGDHGRLGGSTVQYLHQGQPLEELVALYVAADVMLVTPFRDGMNLVAKEYVAAKVDGSGALILSEFAGAAHQLKRALLVNPFDVRGLKSAILEAISGDPREHRRRMAAMARNVGREDAAWWATTFIDALAQT